MTVLVVADLHSQRHIFAPLARAMDALRPDAVLCLGDLTDGKREAVPYTEEFLAIAGGSGRPVLCISGNNDAPESLALLEARGALIDYREVALGDMRVIGIGYAPAGEPFSPRMSGAVLLTHFPPRKEGVPPSVTDAPRFHFAGHFHSRAKVWRMGQTGTTVVNVPSAINHRAVRFEWPEGRVEFVEL